MDIGRCFNEALEVYKRNLGTLVLAAVLSEVLGVLSLTILIGPLAGGWSLMTLQALRRPDKRVILGELFGAFDRFLPLMGLFYVTFLPVLIGTALCLVPGMLLMTIWVFAFFLMVDRQESISSSMSLSHELVSRGGFSNYFLLIIIVLALSIAPSAIPYLGIILGWFLTPLAVLIQASAYLQEVDEKQPLKPKQMPDDDYEYSFTGFKPV